MKFLSTIAIICSSMLVFGDVIENGKLNTKAALNNLYDSKSLSENLQYFALQQLNDDVDVNTLSKRGKGGGFQDIPHNDCENFWYGTYCMGMEQIYRTVCVPYCELNSGRGKKYANQNACKKDFCNDHWECHKDCYA